MMRPLAFAALVAAAAPLPLVAEGDTGRSGATISGRITGGGSVSYVVGALAGQRMTVTLTSDDRRVRFDLHAPGGAAPGEAGGAQGRPLASGVARFDGILPESGAYMIRVHLRRAAARRGGTATFSLVVAVGAGTADAGPPDGADAGGR